MPIKTFKYTGDHKAVRIFGQVVVKGKTLETESYVHQKELADRKDFEEVKPKEEKADTSPKKDAK